MISKFTEEKVCKYQKIHVICTAVAHRVVNRNRFYI